MYYQKGRRSTVFRFGESVSVLLFPFFLTKSISLSLYPA